MMDCDKVREVGAILAEAVGLKLRPVCVYGSDRIPENGVRTASISPCIASAVYQLAARIIEGPIYTGNDPGQFFCRCIGGPAWFGYEDFDPRLAGLMGSKKIEGYSPKYLKENEQVALEMYKSIGKVKPLGNFVVVEACEAIQGGPDIKCMILFGTSGQVRDLCALAYFRARDVLSGVSVPWGPACATLITYPARISENVLNGHVFIGPIDPSAREWLPDNYMAMGIPLKIAVQMAEDVEKSFISKRAKV